MKIGPAGWGSCFDVTMKTISAIDKSAVQQKVNGHSIDQVEQI